MYEFSLTSFFIGLLILAASVVALRFHQQIANNLGSGVSDYDRYKLWALIGCGVGFVVLLNLHVVILRAIFENIFPH